MRRHLPLAAMLLSAAVAVTIMAVLTSPAEVPWLPSQSIIVAVVVLMGIMLSMGLGLLWSISRASGRL